MIALSCVRRGTAFGGKQRQWLSAPRTLWNRIVQHELSISPDGPSVAEHPRDFVQDLRHCAERVTKAAQSVLPRDQTA